MSWPITYVQDKAASTTGTSVSAVFDAVPTDGSLIVVSIGWRWPSATVSIASVVDSAGNTYAQAGSELAETTIHCSARTYYSYNVTGQASHAVTVTFASSVACQINISEWSGASFSHSPYESAAAKAASLLNIPPYDADTNSVNAPSLDGALLIANFCLFNTPTVDALPVMTALAASSDALATYYQIQTTASAASATTSYDSSPIYSARIVVFLPEHHESQPAGGPLPTGAHPAGTISLRQQVTGYVGTTTSSTFITTPKDGSLILVAVTWIASVLNNLVASVTDNAGNSFAAAGPVSINGTSTSSLRCQYWYAYNIVAAPRHTVTITMTDGVTGGYSHLSEWLGVDTTADPLDVVNGNGNTDQWSPYTHSTGLVTPTAHHALVVASFRSGVSPDAGRVAPTGMTALTPVSYLTPYYQIQDAATAINPTVTGLSYGRSYVSRVVVFRAIDAITPPPDSPLTFPTPEAPARQDGVMAPAAATLSCVTGALGTGTSSWTLMAWTKGEVALWLDFGYDYVYADLGPGAYLEVQSAGVYQYSHNEFYSEATEWKHFALVYDGVSFTTYVTHEDLVTFDSDVAARIDAAMPPYAGATTEVWVSDDASALRHLRVWSSALTKAEIQAECRSATVVKASGLYSNVPLTDASDTADVSGNANEWPSDAALTDYIPSRIVPSAPTAITALPYTNTPVALGYGSDWEAWFAMTAGAGERMIGLLATADLSSNFRPKVEVYGGAKSDPYYVPWGSSFDGYTGRVPLEVPTRPGSTYYVRLTNANTLPDTTPIDGNPTVSLVAPPQLPVPAGSILITDDTSSFPLAMLSATDGSVLAFYDYSVGDKGVALPNGYFCIQTSYGTGPRPNFVTMYDDQLAVSAAPSDVDDTCLQISHNGRDTFYISSASPVTPYGISLSTLTVEGEFTYRRYEIPGASGYRTTGFTVAHDDSVVYYYRRTTPPYYVLVHAFDIATSADVEVFRYADTQPYMTDLVMLADGTLLTGGPDGHYVQRWSVTGTLLNTYGPLSCLGSGNGALNRMTAGVDDPQDIWVWVMDEYGYATFHHLNVADGSTIAVFGCATWTGGRQHSDNPTGYPSTINERFGPSNCCSIIVTKKDIVPVVPTPATVAAPRPIRRLRQAPHLSDEQMWLFISSFQLDLETGRGLTSGQGIDPQIMCQWSDDGGHTWSEESWVSAGVQGAYQWRAIWRRLGKSRDRVWRVVVSDPVPWRFLDAYISVEKGTA